MRIESDSIGEIEVPEDRYWGAQTQRSLEHFDIGRDLMPIEVIHAYGLLKQAAAETNRDLGLLDGRLADLIIQAGGEVAGGELDQHFPLHVWMTGSGTQTNMNVNEVIANRAIELAGGVIGSKDPVHPNDHVNLSQSSNDSFPTAMNMAAVSLTKKRLLPEVAALRDALAAKAEAWRGIVKIGRTHMQDAVPLTLGQEVSGWAQLLTDDLARIEQALGDVYQLALGGTAVGTGINADPRFGALVADAIAKRSGLPFVTAPNKFAVQGSHDALVMLHGAFKTLAGSLFKIANDIRLLSCGPRSGLHELEIPANEPGSSIMPGKINPTQCEAMAMLATQVMANDVAVGMGGAAGYLQMNVYKPVMINAVVQSALIMADGAQAFRKYLVEGMEPNLPQIEVFLERSLMLVTALSPHIGYDKASAIAHHAYEHDMSLKEAGLVLGYVTAEDFDRIVDPKTMVG